MWDEDQCGKWLEEPPPNDPAIRGRVVLWSWFQWSPTVLQFWPHFKSYKGERWLVLPLGPEPEPTWDEDGNPTPIEWSSDDELG